MNKWVKRLIFVIGFMLCFIPIISNVIVHRNQQKAIATYQQTVNTTDNDQIKESMESAYKYNSLLYQMQGAIVDDLDLISDESYNKQLNHTGNGIMGSLEIPKINVNLPIYHGTGDEALANGVGHIQGTSLPVGGENTHAVLSGHRGLPSSKLLVRLDEMEVDDYFFLRVGNETLAYKVIDIVVVEPDDVSNLEVKVGEDLVSLVTCTPYGINTHRLIVTGSRVTYEETDYESINATMPSIRECVMTALPFLFVLLILVLHFVDRRKLKNDKNKKIE